MRKGTQGDTYDDLCGTVADCRRGRGEEGDHGEEGSDDHDGLGECRETIDIKRVGRDGEAAAAGIIWECRRGEEGDACWTA